MQAAAHTGSGAAWLEAAQLTGFTLRGVMNHVYLTAVHAQNACRLKLVGECAPQNTPLQKQPPASKHQLVGVLKLLGQVECNFQPDFRECLE